jgi:dTDP-glucose 4,6-dehydratase
LDEEERLGGCLIAVIGASSFSGKAFVEYLRANGEEVEEFSRSVGYDLRWVDNFLGEPEYVVNFASLNMVGESWQHAQDYYRTNVEGVTRLADRLVGRLKKFIQVSTPEVYGTTETFIKEGHSFNPSTPYAVSRAAADMHLMALHKQYGFPVCFTRTVNVYGPGQQPYRIIPKTVLSALKGKKLKLHGGGQSTRSFIHIRDVAEATALVMFGGKTGETYHIATKQQTSIRGLVFDVAKQVGRKFEDFVEDEVERPGKDMAYQLDDSKIRSELGWRDLISFERGLEETVDWFVERANEYESLEYVHKP